MLLHCYTVTLCYTAPGSYYQQSSKLELVREGVKQRRYVKHLNVSPPEEVEQIKHKRWLTASKCHVVEYPPVAG